MPRKFLSEFDLNGTTLGQGLRPYIIAEMACAHDGDPEKARALIDASVEAGADAVQLQYFCREELVTPDHEAFDLLAKIEISLEDWRPLFLYAKGKGIDVFICTYDVPSAQEALALGADGIKLNSADLSNPDVLKVVAGSGIPLTVGTGASSVAEITAGLDLLEEHGADKVVLMHGVQNFPTQIENLNVRRVMFLRETFGLPVGYHDHVDGDHPFGKMVDLLAMGMGAAILEKHITLSRADKGTDYQAALEPAEFKTYVDTIHLAHQALGAQEDRPFTEEEKRYRTFQKKSIVAARDLKAGEKLQREDVRFLRTATNGLAPKEFPGLEGKKVVVDLKKSDLVLLGSVEPSHP